MIASQESLSNKRVHCEYDTHVDSGRNKISIFLKITSDSIKPHTSVHDIQQSLASNNKTILHSSREESDACEDDVSDCFTNKSVFSSNFECYNFDNKSYSTNSLPLDTSIESIQVLPMDSDIFQQEFTPEEHFMINLCNVCDEANAPLDLVNKVVAVFHNAQNNGLNMESNVVCSREYFLRHLNKRFNIPPPESINVTIEDMSGNEQVVTIIHQNFLKQVMDLIHDQEIWGNKTNFNGTIDMDDPFNPHKYGQCDDRVDEVVDGMWYKKLYKNVKR